MTYHAIKISDQEAILDLEDPIFIVQEFKVSLIHQEDFEDLELIKVQATPMVDSVKELAIIMGFIAGFAVILKVVTTAISWNLIIN